MRNEMNGGITMKGTEKQIKYAQELLAKIDKDFIEKFLAAYKAKFPEKDIEKKRKRIDIIIEDYNAENTYAGDIINELQWLKDPEKVEQFFAGKIVVYGNVNTVHLQKFL
jgi:hypothetical protein